MKSTPNRPHWLRKPLRAVCVALLLLTMTAPAPTNNGQLNEGTTRQTIAEKIFHQTPQQIREDLQTAQTGDLSRRRIVIVLSLVGIVAMTMVTLFQTGLVRNLPDLPNRAIFDARRVNTSDQAYKYGLPDGTFVMVSLAVTIALAAFGGANRAAIHAWIPLAFTAKAALDAFFSATYVWNLVTVQKVACIYCTTTALATFLILALTLPETTHALSALRAKPVSESRAATTTLPHSDLGMLE